jgi:hypothetical protein
MPPLVDTWGNGPLNPRDNFGLAPGAISAMSRDGVMYCSYLVETR